MITILFAPPRTGKTCLLTHIACTVAFDRERNRAMRNEILKKHFNGFAEINTMPIHCVSANYDITMRKFGYTPRLSRRINPYKLGFYNQDVKDVHYNFPYEAIFITEAQKYLNSRMNMYYPDWQSRWYEQHGHNNLDIWLDTQRPMLIDVNIRELSEFIEIVKLDIHYDDYYKPCRLKWRLRHIDNSGLFDRYMASGKKDKACYDEYDVVADYNVFACYNSQNCKPKFYQGHFDIDFDYKSAEEVEQTKDGYIKYLLEFDDELPNNFYKKKGDNNLGKIKLS